MAEKFNGKYRIASTRLQNWNYGWAGSYFVTICTKNMRHFFGSITDGTMNLSAIGEIAHREWLKSPIIRPDMNLELGASVVMPNHIHGIITIGENEYNKREPLPKPKSKQNSFGNQSKNLAAVIGGFKSAVTVQARKINPNFEWHVLYHDSIIRTKAAHFRITKYINENPQNWNNDKFFGK